MNTIFETEDREERMERQDSEVTLSTGTLLAIFFGLVVVCGVFFGFGYSMGRHSSDAKAAAAQAAAVPAADEAAAATPSHPKPSALELLPAPAPADQAASPSDDSASPKVVVDQSADAANSTPPAKATPKAAPVRAAAAPVQQPLPATPPQAAPKYVATSAPTTARPVPASLTKPAVKSTIMVQIAAISHPEDAEALVAALKKRGYAVAVHTEPQDKLLHVQVGPFATREDAVAMRQKLLSDGYNAIIK